jgi:hypothetical protein
VLELTRQRIIQEALEHLHAVPSSTAHGGTVEFSRECPRRRYGRRQHGGDCAGAGAEIRR